MKTIGLLAVSVLFLVQIGCNWTANRDNAIGRQAYLSGQYTQAINQFQLALNRDPGNPDALYNLGATYLALGQQTRNTQTIGQAEQLLRQAIANNDQHVEAHRTLAALLVQTQRQGHAFDLLNTWKQRHPESPEPLIELARVYQEMGDGTQSTNLLADALRIDGSSVRALKAMGHVRENQGQLNLALDNYMRSYQLDARQADLATKINELQTRIAQGQTGQSVLSR